MVPYSITRLRTSLKRLITDRIDLSHQRRVAPDVSRKEAIGTAEESVPEVKVRHFRLSETEMQRISRAHAAHPVTASTASTPCSASPRTGCCRRANRSESLFLSGPLGKGFLSSAIDANTKFEGADFRNILPWFTLEARRAHQRAVHLNRSNPRGCWPRSPGSC